MIVVAQAGRYGDRMTVLDAARARMIQSQLRPNQVTDERLIAAIAQIRRELFVPERLRGVAYVDDNLPLGHGRYLMKPMFAARLLQAATVEAADAALVVGAGVGYEAAVLALLAKSVIALEEDPELARIGRSALVDHRIASVLYVEAPLRFGHRQRAPYDVILLAGAVREIPTEISTQLADAGCIAVVLQQHQCVGRATLLTRTGGGLAPRVIFDAAVPLLPGFGAEPGFVF
jgi:protein-L-isoaspartate(D-aspartate) O-methyltransferase